MLALIGLHALGFLLGAANGANDVSKGIATLVGSGVADYRRAIVWGTLWTIAGGLLGVVFAGAMVATFGSGLLSPGTRPTFPAAAATLLGAGAWVLLATRTGLPVSTTHAIVGSLVGVAGLAYGVAGVQWGALGGKILVPLLVSPIVSLLLVVLVLLWARGKAAPGGQEAPGGQAADCLCAEVRPAALHLASATGSAGAVPLGSGGIRVQIVNGAQEACAAWHPRALRLTLDHLHWLTAGATSLARGMNDAPKIAALTAAAAATGVTAPAALPGIFLLVIAGMALGSLVAGRRVTAVLGERVTAMDHREGFVANLVTATLVASGAAFGLPMSTTHVSSCGIVGAGLLRNSIDRSTLRTIVLAWVVTLPVSALLGMAGYAAARAIGLQ